MRSGGNPSSLVLYRNPKWNLLMAAYAAITGIAVFGAAPVVLMQLLVPAEETGIRGMVAVLGIAAVIPAGRMALAGVVLRRGVLVVRNPFRTYRIPVAEVQEWGSWALWQNFVTVTSLRTSQRHIPVLAVPPDDAIVVARALGEALQPYRRLSD